MTELKRFIRRAELAAFIGVGRTTLHELIVSGKFPPAIPLTDSGSIQVWYEDDIRRWQEVQIVQAASRREAIALKRKAATV